MNSMKCPQCGLVNFASAAACKRCQLAFEAAPAGFDGPGGAPPEFAPAGAWNPPGYLPPAFDGPASEAAVKNAKLGKASAMMALLAILSMGLTYFVNSAFRPASFLLLVAGFFTGVVAWAKLRRSGDADGGLRNARLGTILNGLLLVVVTLAVGAVFAFNYVRSAAVAMSFEVRDQPRWREYVSPAGDFSVRLPGRPEEVKFEQRAAGGGSLPISGVGATAADESGCTVTVVDFSGQMDAIAGQGVSEEAFLRTTALSVIRGTDATLINSRNFTHEGRHATEFEFLDPQKSDNPAERLRGVTRAVWAPPRLYVATITAPEESPLYVQRQTFLDSYRLLEGGR